MDAARDPVNAAGYVGRFAPSPTGPLHLGSLVTALASWADARAHGGTWLVRIEDVDATRCSLAMAKTLLEQLAACGMTSDAEVLWQSHRQAAYREALQRLDRAGRLYACTCSRRMLENAAVNAEGERIYPGTCRERPARPGAAAIRFRLRSHEGACFIDRRHGRIEQDVACEVGDFVLQRADGCFAYQLAVVVDDAAQGVTDVVRGDDLLGNTPRQLILQAALGLTRPRYLHLPLVRAANGQKLSKQTQARAIAKDEALPALLSAWRHLGQIDPGRVTSRAALLDFAVRHWQPERLPAPAGMDERPKMSCSLRPSDFPNDHTRRRPQG